MGRDVEVDVDLCQGPDSDATAPGGYAGPTTGTERILAEVLADLVHVEWVSVDSNFFDDLGADSLTMAHFCARVRKRSDLPSVSMKDIYQHSTIKSLTAALTDAAPVPIEGLTEPASPPVESSVPASIEVSTPAGTPQYVLCGALQFLTFFGYSYLVATGTIRGVQWISAGSSLIDAYLRSVVFCGAGLLGLCTLPILAKWILIGRWKPQQIRIWSLAYVRFWIVKTLIRSNPLVLLMLGSPLYGLYLRALGAKVGRGVVILSPIVPVCTDLLTIGDGTVILKNSFLSCYRAEAGLIETGAVTIGRDVFVGEATVIDIETSLGDGAQLGHTSSLHAGQAVPEGERWHGSPAQRTVVDYRAVDPTECGALRRAVYTLIQLLNVLLLVLPLAIGAAATLFKLITPLTQVTQLTHLGAVAGSGPRAFTSWSFYLDALAFSLVVFSSSVFAGFLVVTTIPRLLNLVIEPDHVYRLYGFHYRIHRVITRLSNVKLFTYLFGDSSYIVHYLRSLGYGLTPVVQTGSNFGLEVKHETPFLSSIGSGTQVADGLSIVNADYSSTSFRVTRTSIGRHNFLGNNVTYPSRGRTGDNCLLATKVMVPIDGEIREGVGLLGSPSFEIPRSVQRDSRFDHLKSVDELPRRLAAKNRYNTATMALYLLVRWIHIFGITLLTWAAADLYQAIGPWAFASSIVLSLVFTVTYFVLVERAITAFRTLRPQFCSIYEPYFWWHERFWKVPAMATLQQLFNGTPFKSLLWRMLGMRVGRRLFDDGCIMPERTLVTIGDNVSLNIKSTVQCHSQEDDTFKSDRITIGSGCTIGVGAFVLYGASMGDGAVLAPDSFLMKGEEVPSHAHWGGNPARDMGDDSSVQTATASGRLIKGKVTR